VVGNPDPAHVSASHVERSIPSIRIGRGRFTRLINAFSRNVDHHLHALALYFMPYNFVRRRKTLKEVARDGGWRDR
jgi:hypothetical protein